MTKDGKTARRTVPRGVTPGRSDRQQKPSIVADILSRAFHSPEIKEKVRQYSAFPHWESIVGPELAEVAVPEKIVSGRILYLRVIDSVWAQEIAMMKPQLLDQIRRFGQGALIEDIRCSISNPRAFAEAKKRRVGGADGSE